MKKTKLKVTAIILFVAASIFLCLGIDKKYHYENPDSSYKEHINAYVGGDAYNYIINSNYATGYYVLAAACTTSATILLAVFEIINKDNIENQEKQVQSNIIYASAETKKQTTTQTSNDSHVKETVSQQNFDLPEI